MIQKFTVVLMRPDYVTDHFGQDCFVAYVDAPDERAAVGAGQLQAWKSDNKAQVGLGPHGDYYPLLVFEGHQPVKLLGFQV